MAQRVGFPRGRIRSQRRKTSWGVGAATGTGGTPEGDISSSTAVLATLGAAFTLDGITVVRIRGELTAWLKSAAASAEGFACAFGIGLARLPAFTAGVASVPTPLTDDDDEFWLYHRFFGLHAPDIIAGSASTDGDAQAATISCIRLEVDSKAMRKVDINDVLYGCIETTEGGTAVMNWTFDSRILVKLA